MIIKTYINNLYVLTTARIITLLCQRNLARYYDYIPNKLYRSINRRLLLDLKEDCEV